MTYLYETLPTDPGVEVRRYEIEQAIQDAALTRHPETGEPIRRVILGGWGLPGQKSVGSPASSDSGCGCGPHGCC